MASDEKTGIFLTRWMGSAAEKVAETGWFQQLRAKWEELDPKSRMYLTVAGGIGGLVLFLVVVVSSVWSVRSLKSELSEKNDLLVKIRDANDELRKLKEANSRAATAQAAQGPWTQYFETIATSQAGLEKGNFTVSNEKTGATSELAKETIYDINVKQASIRKVVNLAYQLENGQRPVKVRSLSIDRKGDPKLVDATLSVSAFTLINQNK